MIAKGQRVNDRYEIIDLIGEGGMANVYLADDIILNRKVAVKVLRGDLANDEKFIRRFQREALSASSLNHPNIVEMYDVGEENGQYYIVMEFVEGITLQRFIKKQGALTVPEVIDIMLQLTAGLACAHDAYIIHRDIKSQNILILDNGLVKITDFGIAMAMNNSQLTQTNSLLGSAHYLPPEQVGGKGATMKSDIYSLGILMYEMLVGRIPFNGENQVEIIMKHMQEELPSVRKKNNKIPQSVENIILKATAKNPQNRYNDIKEMQADLETALNEERLGEPLHKYRYAETEEEPAVQPKKKQENPLSTKIEDDETDKQRKKLKILGIILGVLAIIFAAVFIIWPMLAAGEVEIPDVAEMTVEQAESALRNVGLQINEEHEEAAHAEIEEGRVIGTNPPVGTSVRNNATVTLIVSIGPEAFTLEDYRGQNIEDVRAELEAAGLTVRTQEREVPLTEATENGIILEQNPGAGRELKSGDTVTFVVSRVNDTMPNMVRDAWNYARVRAFARDNDLTLVERTQQSSTVPGGQVISQSISAGTRIVRGQGLTVVIAERPPAPETPQPPTPPPAETP